MITIDILFDSGLSVIKKQYFSEIDKIAAKIKHHGEVFVSVEGHTDSIGRALKNQILSKARASAVVEALNKKLQLEEVQLTAIGFGETKPIGDNTTKAGRLKNRRVTVVIMIWLH